MESCEFKIDNFPTKEEIQNVHDFEPVANKQQGKWTIIIISISISEYSVVKRLIYKFYGSRLIRV